MCFVPARALTSSAQSITPARGTAQLIQRALGQLSLSGLATLLVCIEMRQCSGENATHSSPLQATNELPLIKYFEVQSPASMCDKIMRALISIRLCLYAGENTLLSGDANEIWQA